MENKYWVGVACKEHVENGVKLGICQFCHGKKAPANKLKKNDFVIYYSSKLTMTDKELYQKFTAIGIVLDDVPYQIEMENGFKPFRRNIKYFKGQHLEIRPLISKLDFITNKKSWGYVFRYGFLEIDKKSFDLISRGMLGYNLEEKLTNRC
ncbi:MAG: EVE domain-containing protein [Legionellales bacterium]|nr:EVE domain-containing protein [Legionellales bacterium]